MTKAAQDYERAASLLDRGRRLLDDGHHDQAESLFRQAAAACPIPAAYNNWALCRLEAGDPTGALQALSPLLRDPSPAPYSRALASLALQERGDTSEAKRLLLQAIRDFDQGQADPGSHFAMPDAAWIEYTALIKRAAGKLGEHQLVLDLHKRWPGQEFPAGAFAAGVAAFNLGRFARASRYWRRIKSPAWRRRMEAYAQVADLAETGVVPPFPLEYDFDRSPSVAS